MTASMEVVDGRLQKPKESVRFLVDYRLFVAIYTCNFSEITYFATLAIAVIGLL